MSNSINDLLVELKSENNNTRTQAESFLNQQIRVSPSDIVGEIINAASTEDLSMRSFIAILLRKLMEFKPNVQPDKLLLYRLDDECRDRLLWFVLQWVHNEQHDYVRLMVCDLICEIGISIFSQGNIWEALIQWCLDSETTEDSSYKLSFYRVSKELGVYYPRIQVFDIDRILNLFVSGLQYNNLEVQTEAVISLNTIIQFYLEDQDKLALLIDPMLQVLSNNINVGDESLTENVLYIFIELAELNPGFFMPKLTEITNIMIQLASNDDLPDEINRLSALFLVSLSESKPLLCKSNRDFVDSCVKVALKMMVDIEDMEIDTWNDSNENVFELSNFETAEHYLDRLALALEGDIIIPVIMPYFAEFSQSPHWQYRHGLLRALAVIGEGCADYLFKGLQEIISLICGLFADPHPRVRWAALHTIGQLSTDLGPQIQIYHHEAILNVLIKGLRDPYSKVQEHAAAAVLNFMEKFERYLLEPYLPEIMDAFFPLISTHCRAQEQAIVACSVVGWCARDLFAPYYDKIFEVLISIFQNTTSKTEKELRGKSIEAIATMSIGIGETKFLHDAPLVINLLNDAQDRITDSVDVLLSYFESAWIKISTALGPHFGPYLDLVLPTLIEQIGISTHLRVSNTEVELPGWEYYDVDDMRIGINQIAVDQKLQALTIIGKFAANTENAFFPYINQISQLVIPLLDNANHDLRLQSYKIIPNLLQCARYYVEREKVDNDVYHKLFDYLYPPIIEAAAHEFDVEIMEVVIESINLCLRCSGTLLTNKQLINLIGIIQNYVKILHELTDSLMESNLEEDADFSTNIKDELFEQFIVVEQISELFGTMMKYHSNILLPLFQQIGFLEYIISLITTPVSSADVVMGICFFDDIVDHGKEASRSLYPHFLPILLNYISHADYLIRQAVTFGLGCCAEHGGDDIIPFLENILPALVELITKDDSMSKTNLQATENAITAFGKIIHYQKNYFGEKLNELITLWLSWLPIVFDESEALVAHQIFCNLFFSDPQTFLTQHVLQSLTIISTVIDSDLIKHETREQMISIIKSIGQEDIGANAMASLPQNQQSRLRKFF